MKHELKVADNTSSKAESLTSFFIVVFLVGTLNTKLLFFVVDSNLYGIKCVKAFFFGLVYRGDDRKFLSADR